jgi:hypothetical protein
MIAENDNAQEFDELNDCTYTQNKYMELQEAENDKVMTFGHLREMVEHADSMSESASDEDHD